MQTGMSARTQQRLWREIGDVQAVAPLILALGDKRYARPLEAAEALGEIRDARAVVPLIQALGDEYWRVRLSVAAVLGEIGDAQVVASLIQLFGDANFEVRQAAVTPWARSALQLSHC